MINIESVLFQAAEPAWRASLPIRRKAPDAAEPYEICMVVISDVRNDPRVRREAETLAKAGYRIKIIYPDCYSPKFAESPITWSENIVFRPLPCEWVQFHTSWPYVFGEEFHAAVCEERPWAFHSHDLNTALIALSAAQTAGAYCVCDFHEWYSENVSWDNAAQGWGPHPEDKREVFKALERIVMRNANAVITVTDSIADAIRDELANGVRRPRVIRNVPKLSYEGGLGDYDVRKELGVGPETFVVLWQGGIGPSRLLEPVIQAFKDIPDAVFGIRTPYWDAFGAPYDALAAELGISEKIRRLDAVPSQDIVRSAKGADVGLWTLPNPSRNFYLALGNKIFEYMAAGLPLLVADYPEPRRIIDDHGIGLTFDPYSPESIAEAINAMRTDPQRLQDMRSRVPVAFDAMGADQEWEKLVHLYEDLREHGVADAETPVTLLPEPDSQPVYPQPAVPTLTGFPAEVVRPNARYSAPYCANRKGMKVQIRSSSYLSEQGVSLWWDDKNEEAALLRRRLDLPEGDILEVTGDPLYDFAVGSPMVAVRHEASAIDGFIMLDSLITKTVALEGVWAAQDPATLRPLVEFSSANGMLYSTNRVGPDEIAVTHEYLEQFETGSDEDIDNVHPLQCGAHSHRIGVWALDSNRSEEERARVAHQLDQMMQRYLVPKMINVTDKASAWAYTFDFRMPWGTALTPPWYSGYANASIVGAAACAYALTGKEEYADVSRRAFAFLQLPMANGGAWYSVDGFDFIAEYVYRSPPVPNLRVLDGEMCAIPYIVNAGQLLDEPGMVDFGFRLAAGQTVLIDTLKTPDGAPLFGADGQAMNPGYMWQIWMCIQLLAAIFKDRTFTEIAHRWTGHIPEEDRKNYPM